MSRYRRRHWAEIEPRAVPWDNAVDREPWRRTQRWGFALSAGTTGPGQTVLTVKSDAPQAWTLNLLAWRYQAGGLVTVGTVTPAPDNQTVLDPCTCTMVYGVDGASERVTFDYWRQGGTIPFSAQYADLYVNFPTSAIAALPPLLGGFVSPQAPSGASAGFASQPTLTFTLPPIAASANLDWFDIPARARAYRFIPLDANSVTQVFSSTQLSRSATRAHDFGAGTARENLVVQDNAAQNHLFTQRSQWIPLDTDAAGLFISNGALNTLNLRVQFLLDLG